MLAEELAALLQKLSEVVAIAIAHAVAVAHDVSQISLATTDGRSNGPAGGSSPLSTTTVPTYREELLGHRAV